MRKIDKNSLDYKLGYYSYRFCNAQWIPFKIVSGTVIALFVFFLLSKYTPYYIPVRDFFAYKDWFIKVMMGLGGYTVIMLFIGMSALDHELFDKDRD